MMLVNLRRRRTPLHFLTSIDWSPQGPLRNLSKPTTAHKNPLTPSPLAISYLVDTCGLSPADALFAAAKLNFKSTQNPDAVLALLRHHGFANKHIASLIAKHPNLLAADPDKIIKPKLDFFLSIGFSGPDIGKLVSVNPTLIKLSLENKLLPNFNTLKTILGTKEVATAAIRSSTWILHSDPETRMFPAMELMKNHGISATNIVKVAARYPRVLVLRPEIFEKFFFKAKKMGLDPSSTMFVYAIGVMSGLSSSMWDRKLELYRSLGWSEEDKILAFMKQPLYMLVSEHKVRQVMDFLVKKLGWVPSSVAQWPTILMMDLEKMIQRSLVWNILQSKGLLSKRSSLPSAFMQSEKRFLESYVTKYAEQVPELLEAYQGKKSVEIPQRHGGTVEGRKFGKE